MRTEAELRARLAVMKERARDPRIKRTYGLLLFTATDALQWVLGERYDEHGLQGQLDAEAARPMRWTRQGDGSYVSDRGYVILKYGDGNWVVNRSATEPVPGWNSHTTLAIAKQHAQQDYDARQEQRA
jgi:hypothetical protein